MKKKVINKQNSSKMCFVCGIENESGLRASFFELENNLLVGKFSPCKFHQGYPGRLHGGIASTILDEAMGRAILISDSSIWGVTVELNVKFKKPIPLENEVKVICKLTSESSRLFEAEGKIVLANGEEAVIAQGKYIKLPLSKITIEDFIEDQWFKVETGGDPKEIEIH
jgi:acyl-coenzyme A thioesterase PaaI-like protein